MLCADYEDYIRMQDQVGQTYLVRLQNIHDYRQQFAFYNFVLKRQFIKFNKFYFSEFTNFYELLLHLHSQKFIITSF